MEEEAPCRASLQEFALKSMFPFVTSLRIRTLCLGSSESSQNCVVAAQLLRMQEGIIFLKKMKLLMTA